MSIAAVLSALLLLPAWGAAPPDTVLGSVEGAVFGRVGTELRPLPGAVVELDGPHGVRSTTADGSGRYRIADVRAGDARLSVRSLGYAPTVIEVTVPGQRGLTLDVELEAQPLALAPVLVEGASRTAPLPPQARRPAAVAGADALRAAAATSGVAESGLAGALRELGRRSDHDPSSALLLRGTSTEGKLVLLDGSPVYTPFHVAGLVPGFDANLLGEVDVHVGGAPSRFDGGLAYIMDLRTRAPRADRFRSTGAVDGLGARASVEGPLLPGTTVLLGGRALHGLQPRIMDGVASPYGYGDLLLRADTDLGDGHGVTTTAFRNRESVRLDGIQDVARAWTASGDPAPSSAFWSSGSVSGRYRGAWGGTAAELGVGFSRYEAQLPFRLSTPYLASAGQERVRAGTDFSRRWEEGSLHYGLASERQLLEYRIHPLEGGGGDAPLAGHTTGTVTGGYVEGIRFLGEEFRGRFGVRADHFAGEGEGEGGGGGGVRLAPRISLSWFLSDTAELILAGGRFHQFRAGTGIETEAELLQESRQAGWEPRLAVSTADHLVLSLNQRLTPSVGVELDGFLKQFDAGPDLESDGTIHTSGVEVRVQREGERIGGWMGYGLTWVWSQRGMQPATEFVGRQLLNAGVQGQLTERARVALTVGYGAGLPLTSIPMDPLGGSARGELTGGVVGTAAGGTLDRFRGSEADGTPLLVEGISDDFLRIDFEADWQLTTSIGGRRMKLHPYVRVLNALNRRDALFYLFEPWRSDQATPLAERSLIPVLGLRWSF